MSIEGNGARGAYRARVDELLDDVAASRLDDAYAATSGGAVAVAERDDEREEIGEPLSEADVDDNLRRYAWWQARDFLRNRAIWLIPLGLVALWIFRDYYDTSRMVEELSSGRRGRIGSEPALFEAIVMGLSAAGALLGSLVATVGIVARERERGLQRFLFAKPVRITSYYLQAFVINGIGLLAVLALMLLLTALVFLRPVPFLDAMLVGAVSYVMLGGFSFLLSTLVRFDLPAAGLLSALSLPVFAIGERWRYPIATVGRWLLPPVPALIQLVEPSARVLPFGQVGAAALCLGYGLACIAGAVAVLRRRSITA